MKAKFKLNGKEIVIDNIRKVSGLGKLAGLMFKNKETDALLFSFNKPGKYSIHSYFCQPFLAIWLNNGKIVEHKLVAPNKVIKPENEFDSLIEIPFNDRYKQVFNFFVDGERFK